MENKPCPSDTIKVRFAPSPTGYLHIGGARPALFNWLFARHHKGTFILRIEDTDRERSEDRFWKQILEDLEWLGLNWDEGPIFQYDRKDIYDRYAQQLIQEEKAYHCFCAPKQIQDKSYNQKCPCGQIQPDQAKSKIAAGEAASIRFRTPHEGNTEFKDLVRKRVSFDNKEIDDFIIIRSNGQPTYNLSVTIDDALNEITHVIRGDDHISNTPKQIMLYQALNFQIPQFVHIPMIMGPDNTRLSKRHGATAVGEYRKKGYLPQAMINYLALLGWAYNDRQTIFSLPELIEKFSLQKVSKKAAIFDPQKMEWMNGKYIRKINDEEFISHALPYLSHAGLISEDLLQEPTQDIKQIVLSVRDRMKLFSDLPELVNFFFTKKIRYTEEAHEKIFSQPNNLPMLKELHQRLERLETFDEEAIDTIFQELIKERGLKLGDLIHPVRSAVSGKTTGPGIFLMLVLLGKDRVLERLENIFRHTHIKAVKIKKDE